MFLKKNIRVYFKYFILLLFLSGRIESQTKDSLLSVLKKAIPDTEKVKTLNELAVELEEINKDSAFLIANEALSLSKKIKWKCGEALSLHRIGYLYGEQSEFKKETDYYLNALQIWNAIPENDHNSGSLNGKASTIGNLALVYHKTGSLDKAETLYLESIKIFTALNYTRNVVGQTVNLGALYSIKGDFTRALKIYLIGLDACKKIKNKRQEASIAGNIGNLYKEQKMYGKAIEFTEYAIRTAKEANSKHVLAVNTGNLGTIYYLLKKFTLALQFFDESVKLKEQTGNLMGMAGTISNIGNVYKTIGDSLVQTQGTFLAGKEFYDKAKPYYEKAMKIKKELGDLEGEGIVKGNYGAMCIKTGEYKKAEELLKESSQIALKLNDVIGIIETNEKLGELYELTGNYDLSIKHYMLFKNTRDSVFNADKRSELTRQELNYEYEKKTNILRYEMEKKEAIALAESKRKKILIAFMIAFFTIILSVSLYILKNLRKAKKQKSLIERQKEIVEEKQREILDSIHYAKRIQKALIPSEKLVWQQIKHLRNG